MGGRNENWIWLRCNNFETAGTAYDKSPGGWRVATAQCAAPYETAKLGLEKRAKTTQRVLYEYPPILERTETFASGSSHEPRTANYKIRESAVSFTP